MRIRLLPAFLVSALSAVASFASTSSSWNMSSTVYGSSWSTVSFGGNSWTTESDSVPVPVVKSTVPLVLVSSITLNAGAGNYARSIVEDATYLYVSVQQTGKIYRVRKADFTVVDSMTLATTGAWFQAIDTVNRRLYIGHFGSPGKVSRVNLDTFTEIGSPVTLPTNHNIAAGIVVDVGRQAVYVGNADSGASVLTPGWIDKIDIASWSVVATATGIAPIANVQWADRGFHVLTIDSVNDMLYAGENTGNSVAPYQTGMQVMKVRLDTFTRVASTYSATAIGGIGSLFIDHANDAFYCVSTNVDYATYVAKYSLSGFAVQSVWKTSATYNGSSNFGSVWDSTRNKLFYFGAYKDFSGVISTPGMTELEFHAPAVVGQPAISVLRYYGGILSTDRFIYMVDLELAKVYKFKFEE